MTLQHVLTLAVGWFTLPPARQPALLEHAQSSLFYLENWTLIEQAISYSAVDPGGLLRVRPVGLAARPHRGVLQPLGTVVGVLAGRPAGADPAAAGATAGLVIAADLRSDDPRAAAYWLSRRPVTFIANRAYALYLWHWPVYAYWMALTETRIERIGVGGSVLVLGVSLLLADLSTRLVERRFHRLEVLDSKRGALSAIAVFLIIVVGLVEGMTRALDVDVARTVAGDNPGARAVTPGEAPSTPPGSDRVRGAAPGDSVIGGDWPTPATPCGADLDPQPPVLPGGNCYEVRPDGPPTAVVVLIGDSHSYQWSSVLVPMATARDWHLVMPNHPRCRVTLENPWSDSTCVEYSQRVVDYVLQVRADHVVTIGSRSQPRGPELEVATCAEAIRPVVEAGIPVINIRDNPRWTFSMPECVQRWGLDSPRCTAPRHEKIADDWPRDSLRDLPNMRWLDFTEHFCPGGREAPCPGVLGNVYVYMDDNHISRTYATSLQDEFEAQWDAAVA